MVRFPLQTLKDQQDFLKRKKVVVKFKHLNPVLREIIGEHFLSSLEGGYFSLRKNRSARFLYDFMAADSVANRILKRPEFWGEGTEKYIGPTAFGARTVFAKDIQAQHQKLVEEMNRHGILLTSHEGNYPRDWMRTAEVARTHPIFYVAMNGDMVFLKENWKERLRWKYQNGPGKLGLNLWRWRAYLRPPKALQPIGETVRGLGRKVGEKVGSLGGKPAPVPARVLRSSKARG